MRNNLNNKFLKAESFHYYDSKKEDYIFSVGSKIFASFETKIYEFRVPLKKRYFLFEKFRIFRRLLRLDMMNVIFSHSKDGLIIIYMGNLYFFNFKENKLKLTNKLKESRNVPYNSIAITKNGIYFGEYFSNKNRKNVNIWCSRDDGNTWSVIHKLPGSKTRHIHGIYYDKYTDSLWICTGDLNGECFLYNTSQDFSNINIYGDGSQKWRPISLIFEENFIIWGMTGRIINSLIKEVSIII